MNKLLTLGILFSTAVRAALVPQLVILGILFLTSFTLALRAAVVTKLLILGILSLFILPLRPALVAKLVISDIFSSIIFIWSLYTSFLTTSFLLHYLVYLVYLVYLSTSNLSSLLFKLLKPLGTVFNLSISKLSASDFKLSKSTFLGNFDVSTRAAFFKFAFVG